MPLDLAWCGQCFEPVRRADPGGSGGPEDRPLWIRTQMRDREPAVAPVFSRLKAGPTSFGVLGRSVLTVLVLLGAAAGYPLSRGFMVATVGFDVPGRGYTILYGAVAALLAAYLLARIWRRARVA